MTDPQEIADMAVEILAKLRANSPRSTPLSACEIEEIQKQQAARDRRWEREHERAEAEGRAFIEGFDFDGRAGEMAVWAVRRHCPVPDAEAFAFPKQTIATTAVRRFMGTSHRILVLSGGVGVGKTFAAAEAFAMQARDGYAARLRKRMEASPANARDAVATLGMPRVRGEWVHAAELARRVDPWRQDTEAGVERLDLDSPLVVLDDLGVESDSDRFFEALGTFIDARCLRGKTIVTTNLAKPDIRRRYGDRIADRLNHVGACVELKGKSMRRKAGF